MQPTAGASARPLLLCAAAALAAACAVQKPLVLRTAAGVTSDRFGLHESIHFEAERLSPAAMLPSFRVS